MQSPEGDDHPLLRPSVFVSYASQDRDAALLIRDILASAGIDGWCDESELAGGDAWDQKIRRQIRECDYFMPVVSRQTEARHEGYFRREWRLAVERSLDMADDRTFLLPVVIDDTEKVSARVPEKFLTVQWIKVPNGQETPALLALCSRLTSPEPVEKRADRKRVILAEKALSKAEAPRLPPFPKQETGQTLSFLFHVVGWAFRSTWVTIQRLPRVIRLAVYVYLVVLLLNQCSSSKLSH